MRPAFFRLLCAAAAAAAALLGGPARADCGLWPFVPAEAPDAYISQPFGEGVHSGVDIAVPEGTPVRTPLPGRVVWAGEGGDYGLAVMVDAGRTLLVFGHLSVVGVRPAQFVAAGDLVGLSGNTGRSTGPHLHFEARLAGRRVDPLGLCPGPPAPTGSLSSGTG